WDAGGMEAKELRGRVDFGINWLHLSDLRTTTSGSALHDPQNRDELDRDLRALHATAGPWDLVLLTGDLTETGSPQEFRIVDTSLDSLLRMLGDLGSKPVLLAVPGTHDASQARRSESAKAWLDTARRMRLRAAGGGDVEKGFLAEANFAFSNYSDWYRARRP